MGERERQGHEHFESTMEWQFCIAHSEFAMLPCPFILKNTRMQTCIMCIVIEINVSSSPVKCYMAEDSRAETNQSRALRMFVSAVTVE